MFKNKKIETKIFFLIYSRYTMITTTFINLESYMKKTNLPINS